MYRNSPHGIDIEGFLFIFFVFVNLICSGQEGHIYAISGIFKIFSWGVGVGRGEAGVKSVHFVVGYRIALL